MAFDFAPHNDVLFTTFGVAAEYFPQAGVKAAVTVVTRRPEVAGALLGGGVVLSPERQAVAIEADVRVSEVPTASRGDTLVIGEQPYAVIRQPELDREKSTWRLALRETTR